MTRRVIDSMTRCPHDGRMTNNNNTTTTNTTTRLIDVHLAAYCEPDAARRAELIASVWSADGVLIDPPFDAAGYDGISAVTEAVLAHYPGHAFRRTTAVDEHHGIARYGWVLEAADGTVAVSGLDVADLTPDGDRLARIVGFFGALV